MKTPFSLNKIDSIIFDLGKVIINLEMANTERAFQAIFKDKYKVVFKELEQNQFFNLYETGKISTQEFIGTLIEKSEGRATEYTIKKAWNAMLLDIPTLRFDLLKWAKVNFKTYCLSNTNELHIEFIHDMLREKHQLTNLDSFFHRVYFSHEMGLRKPDPLIFQSLIDKHSLNPAATLFIDDTSGHLVGAKETGLRTYHLKEGEKIEDLILFS